MGNGQFYSRGVQIKCCNFFLKFCFGPLLELVNHGFFVDFHGFLVIGR